MVMGRMSNMPTLTIDQYEEDMRKAPLHTEEVTCPALLDEMDVLDFETLPSNLGSSTHLDQSSEDDCTLSSSGATASTHVAIRGHPTEKLGAWIRGNAITNVVVGCPAERAGLAVGMRILEVNGVPTAAAETSMTVRRLWREEAEVSFKVEVVATRSKRSLAKSRARRRQRAVAKEQAHAGKDSASEPTDAADTSAASMSTLGAGATPAASPAEMLLQLQAAQQLLMGGAAGAAGVMNPAMQYVPVQQAYLNQLLNTQRESQQAAVLNQQIMLQSLMQQQQQQQLMMHAAAGLPLK